MKRIIFILSFFFSVSVSFSQIGIGTVTPDVSTVLHVSSDSKGVLFPSMTSDERDNITNPANGLLIYNLSEECLQVNVGTPTLPNWGCVGIENTILSGSCSGFSGVYVAGESLNASHTFTTTVTNNTDAGVSLDFQSTDLTLSGNMTGVSVSSVSPSGVTAIAANGSIELVFTLSGTLPATTGDLIASFRNTGVVCTGVQAITQGDAEFNLPQIEYVLSVHDGPPLVSIDGLIDNATNQIVVDIPYTGGIGSYGAFNGSANPVSNNSGSSENGDVNGFYLSYPAGSLSGSGTITATVGVDGDGSFEVNNENFGEQTTIVSLDFVVNDVVQGVITIIGVGGIPDREFDDPQHKFVYKPILGFDGNYWLNQDLGANYANFNSDAFNIDGESTSPTDFNAYGSLFQWGRYSDGHELMNWNASTGSLNPVVAGSTSTQATDPRPVNPQFIVGTGNGNAQSNWLLLTPMDNTLWDGEAATNNPCPEGWRVPSLAEFQNLVDIEEISNAQDASNSRFGFTATGQRFRTGGVSAGGNNTGITVEYWTSTSGNDTSAPSFRFLASSVNTGFNAKVNGRKIRCIQE